MGKKKDLPAMPFYFGDWRKAPEIRALDLDVRMIWFEMLGFMWESTERGYLTINGNPVITPVISRMLGVSENVLEKALEKMEEFEVFSRRKDSAIYCRRMVEDERLRLIKSKAGKKGMKNRYDSVITDDITPVITNCEDETEYENKYFKVTKDKHKSYIELYSGIDIFREYKEMELWLDSNPKNRKKDYNRFIHGWLKRSHKDKPIKEKSAYEQMNEQLTM